MFIIVLEGKNLATVQNANYPKQFHLSSPDDIPMSSLKKANKLLKQKGICSHSYISITRLNGWPHLNYKLNTWKDTMDTDSVGVCSWLVNLPEVKVVAFYGVPVLSLCSSFQDSGLPFSLHHSDSTHILDNSPFL